MRKSILLSVAFVLGILCTSCFGDLVMDSTATDISGGATHLISNADGAGLDLLTSFSGGPVNPADGSIAFAGYTLGSDASRFGWTFDRTGGVTVASDIVYRIEATNGTFDAWVGFEKLFGSPLDNLSFRTDGTWATVGVGFTQTGDTVASNGGTVAFASGATMGGFNSQFTGATFVEVSSAPQFVQFAASETYDFDLYVSDSSVVPEPSAAMLILLCIMGLAYPWRLR